MLCGSLDGRGVWGRMDTCIRMAESLHCPPETITTLLIGYNPTQNAKKKKKKDKVLRLNIYVTLYKALYQLEGEVCQVE